jgi:hypothetical protein
MGLGLAAAAVIGVISYTILELGIVVVLTALSGRELKGAPLFNVALVYMIVGMPIALFLSLAVGLPIWKFAEVRRLRSRRSALILGASTGAVIGLLLSLLPLVFGLLSKSSYNEWQGGHQIVRDGLPTLRGWFYMLVYLMQLAAVGSIGGLTAHWVAAPAISKG